VQVCKLAVQYESHDSKYQERGKRPDPAQTRAIGLF
jgi:hypothetical protein